MCMHIFLRILCRYTCRKCGTVVQRGIISEDAEWRDFKDSDRRGGDPNRVGQKEDAGAILSTVVGRTDIGMNLSTRGVYSAEERRAERLQRANVEIRDLARKLKLKQRHAQFVIEMYKRVFDVREATDVKESNEITMKKDFNGLSVEVLIRNLTSVVVATIKLQ